MSLENTSSITLLKNYNTYSPFESLPKEVVCYIVSFCETKLSLRFLNKRFCNLIETLLPLSTIKRLKAITFLLACAKGNLKIVQELRSYSKKFPNYWYFCGLSAAYRGGHSKVVGELLKTNRNLKPIFYGLFWLACQEGRFKVVKEFLKSAHINPAAHSNLALRVAYTKCHVKIMELLLLDPRVEPSVIHEEALIIATRTGDVERVKLLLNDSNISAEARQKALSEACCYNQSEVVRALLENSRLDEKAIYDTFIDQCKKYNCDLEIAKEFLKCPRLDPSKDGNSALREASSHDDLSLANLLLQDGRVQLVEFINRKYAPIFSVAHWSKHEIPLKEIEEILKDPKVDPSREDNMLFRLAYSDRDENLMELLQRNFRVDPIVLKEEELCEAADKQNLDQVNILIEDSKISKAACYRAFYNVLRDRKPNLELVQKFLKDSRVDPSIENNKALACARSNKHQDIINLLLNDPRVQRVEEAKKKP